MILTCKHRVLLDLRTRRRGDAHCRSWSCCRFVLPFDVLVEFERHPLRWINQAEVGTRTKWFSRTSWKRGSDTRTRAGPGGAPPPPICKTSLKLTVKFLKFKKSLKLTEAPGAPSFPRSWIRPLSDVRLICRPEITWPIQKIGEQVTLSSLVDGTQGFQNITNHWIWLH
jgi:hypothetical protein